MSVIAALLHTAMGEFPPRSILLFRDAKGLYALYKLLCLSPDSSGRNSNCEACSFAVCRGSAGLPYRKGGSTDARGVRERIVKRDFFFGLGDDGGE